MKHVNLARLKLENAVRAAVEFCDENQNWIGDWERVKELADEVATDGLQRWHEHAVCDALLDMGPEQAMDRLEDDDLDEGDFATYRKAYGCLKRIQETRVMLHLAEKEALAAVMERGAA